MSFTTKILRFFENIFFRWEFPFSKMREALTDLIDKNTYIAEGKPTVPVLAIRGETVFGTTIRTSRKLSVRRSD